MPNGEGLLGGTIWNPEYGSTTTQSAIIIPIESDSSKYLLFTLYPFGIDTGLHYSIIDMTLNGGNGDVIIKNIPLLQNSLTEKMAAVRHANGKDWWVFVHELHSKIFVSFLVKDSIVEGPFYQEIGSKLSSGNGEMKISLDGTKLATASGDGIINLFAVNRCTGMLSEFIDLSALPETFGSYGCSFSPSGNRLYLSTTFNQIFNQVLQFDLLSPDIIQSMTTIWANTFTDFLSGALQIGPDKKIYLTLWYYIIPNDTFTLQNQYLSVINDPDLIGLSCNFEPNKISLETHRSFLGLPNMPNYNLAALEGSPCDTVTSINEFLSPAISARIYPNPVNNSSILRYDLQGENEGKLVIYNLLGQQIGEYSLSGKTDWISLNFDDILSGVYGYVVIAGEKIISKDNFIISH